MSEKENSYIPHKRRLLKSFDKSIERGEQTLIDYYGIERASSLINEARREYEIIIPRIPFIGHRSPFLLFLFRQAVIWQFILYCERTRLVLKKLVTLFPR